MKYTLTKDEDKNINVPAKPAMPKSTPQGIAAEDLKRYEEISRKLGELRGQVRATTVRDARFIRTKFRTADDTSYIVRDAALSSGIPVIFRVSGVNLSTLISEGIFPNFDAESDKKLKELEETVLGTGVEQVYFTWVGNAFHRM